MKGKKKWLTALAAALAALTAVAQSGALGPGPQVVASALPPVLVAAE